MGICGGAQLINVACGGTLIQDLKKDPINHEQVNPRNHTSHSVNISKNTQLHKICGTEKINVNSQSLGRGEPAVINCHSKMDTESIDKLCGQCDLWQ